MTDVNQYLNDTLTVEVDCTDHRHEVEVEVTGIAGIMLKVETLNGYPFCSMRDVFTGWMTPSTEVPGLVKPPLVGSDEDGYSLLQI